MAPLWRVCAVLPWLVLLSGVAYALYLQGLVPDESFFSGDGGLKALMTRQLAEGPRRFDLLLEAPPEVQSLWDAGLYPFEPPFVYLVEGLRYIQYSFPFPMLSSLPYALFGQRGLYLLPFLSVVLLALAFLRAAGRLQLGPGTSALGLAAVLFGSPLSFYGATFWEHAPAVFLAFAGLLPLLAAPGRTPPSGLAMRMGGLGLGLAVWLREELLCLLAGLVLIAALERLAGRRGRWLPEGAAAHLVTAVLVVLVYFTLNALIYGHPLGPHSFSVLLERELTLAGRLANAWILLQRLAAYLLDTFPLFVLLLWFPAVLLPSLASGRRRRDRGPGEEARAEQSPASRVVPSLPDGPAPEASALVLLVVSLLFALGIPLLLPDVELGGDGGKQWGPRFYLPLVPLVSLCLAILLQALWRARRLGIRYLFGLIFLLLLAAGAYRNMVQGTEHLQIDYERRVEPAIVFLRTAPEPDIAVIYQHMAHEMLPALPGKHWYLTAGPGELVQLANGLLDLGRDRFLYVLYYTNAPPEAIPFDRGAERLEVRFGAPQQHGIYTVYEAGLVPRMPEARP
jgi:hypothetical protein